MKLQRFNGPTTQNAMAKIQDVLGMDAWIYSTATIPGGVEIIAGIPDPTDEQLEDNSLIKFLNFDTQEFIEGNNICALVGPTGIGKTTTIVKLMKRFVDKFHASDIGVITTDYFDIAVKNQLHYFTNFYGVDLAYANSADELTTVLDEMKDKRLVLIDTYGVSQRDTANIEVLKQLLASQGDKISVYLTLPCNVQEAILEEIGQAFRTPNLKGCILTKQDEAITLGAALCVCIMHKFTISYICNGPNVHRDIYHPTASNMFKGINTKPRQESVLCV